MDPLLALMHMEVDMLRRQVELEELRKIRLQARVAGRTDRPLVWIATEAEDDDELALAALREFRPMPWWEGIE